EEFWREKYGFLPCSTEDTQSIDKAEQAEVLLNTALADIKPAQDSNALKEVAAESELMNMPGLKDAKNKITRIIASRQLSLMRSKMGFKAMHSCPHLCFMGNPGTAKTTVARLLKDILFARGILSNDVFIECGRADLVGEHIGETAQLVRKKFDEAMGGILFIDEAYSLIGYGNDFGREAITTIVQEMENRRDDVMVILAGYPREMEHLLDMNEGLRSRIGDKISFEDYSEDELMEIMVSMAEKHSLVLSDDAKAEVRRIVAMAKTEKNFGNGRFMRQLLENGYENMALRVVKETIDKEDVSLLRKCDFASLRPIAFHAKEKAYKKIGFRLEKETDKESND
ncbi:MAG: AAA family ATPase, partial [Phascolarctobacterium sp.]